LALSLDTEAVNWMYPKEDKAAKIKGNDKTVWTESVAIFHRDKTTDYRH